MLLALVGACAAASCGGGVDPYAPIATYDTSPTAFTVYPLRNLPDGQYSAVDLRTPQTLRPGLQLIATSSGTALVPNFDVAFDIDASGRVLLLPPKLLTSAQIIPRTGFQISSTLYDSLSSAPGGDYKADSAFAVTPGQTVVVQAQGAVCSVALPFYAKLVIDKVDPVTRAISIRALIDPNCGFRSFAPGRPKS